MHYKILTQNGVNFTNIDEARNYWFNSGGRDGIVKGAFNEGKFITLQGERPNGILFDTCELRVGGHRIVVDEAWSKTYSSMPSVAERKAVIAEVVINDSSAVTFRIFDQLASVKPIKNELYKNANGAGTYQVEIGRFTLTTNGTITDVGRTLDVITGGSGATGEHFVSGDITTTTLDAGMDANVTAEDIYNANGDYEKTNFSFELPATAGTVVKVDDVEQANLDFTSDPQVQLNNRYTKLETDDLLDDKLDKKTGTNVVYTNNGQGEPAALPYSQASNVGNAVVQRKTSGAIAVPTPTANEDAVPKSYVDNTTSIHTLWTGSITSGEITLSENFSNYNILYFKLVNNNNEINTAVILSEDFNETSISLPFDIIGKGSSDDRYFNIYKSANNKITVRSQLNLTLKSIKGGY